MLKDPKNVKSEKGLNQLIQKNKGIQAESDSISLKIEEAKQITAEIAERLSEIINNDSLQILLNKYKQKAQLVDDAKSAEMRTMQNVDRIDANIQKHLDLITDVLKKLDSVNPINNPVREDKDFFKQISQKIEEANAMRDETIKHK